MIRLTYEQCTALGFEHPFDEFSAHPVELEEVKGATIAGLYMDDSPQSDENSSRWKDSFFKVVLVLSDGRVITIEEGGQAGWMEAEFSMIEGANND
jgi:hypothetical protein